MTTWSLDAARSGIISQQRNLELIANNLANVNTTGYKAAQLHFQDVLDASEILDMLNGEAPPDGELSASSGVQVGGVSRDLAQGQLRPTEQQLDFAIVGTGYFRIRLEDGSLAYTRDGVFSLDGDNNLVTQSGDFVEPGLDLPIDFSDMRIASDGVVTVMRPQTQEELDALPDDAPRDGIRVEVGRIGLTRFVNPAGLESIGENLFIATVESQEPIDGFPGEDGLGEVYSGWLEASNVDIATEMTSLVLASRAYQLNVRAYQTLEQMLTDANELV
jgi:flagellar basal-body rod protein FlgG